jgi:hypothetical protein
MPADLQTEESHQNSPIEPSSLQGKAIIEDQSDSDSASENPAQVGMQTGASYAKDQVLMRKIMDLINNTNDTLASYVCEGSGLDAQDYGPDQHYERHLGQAY